MRYITQNYIEAPVYGAGSDIPDGTALIAGTTAATNLGSLIPATGSSATPYVVGTLNGKNTFSTDADTLVNGTVFNPKKIDLLAPINVLRIEYDLASLIACTQAVTTATMTVTSQETSIETSFIYVVSGTGAGQTNYLTAAQSTWTLKAAFGTSLDTTSNFIKILRRFHRVGAWNTDGTKLGSQAAAGSVMMLVLDSYFQVSGVQTRLDPTKQAALTGLNNARGLKFVADIIVRNLSYYSID